MRNKINLLLIIIWMAFIFIMSSQPGEVSGATSGRFVEWLTFIGIDPSSSVGDTIHLLIRKGAHLFEYFILSLLFYNYFQQLEGPKVYLLPIVFSFLYACSDEYHQTFVPNRAGTFQDVMIDTTGAILAMVFVWVYRKTIKKWDFEVEE